MSQRERASPAPSPARQRSGKLTAAVVPRPSAIYLPRTKIIKQQEVRGLAGIIDYCLMKNNVLPAIAIMSDGPSDGLAKIICSSL